MKNELEMILSLSFRAVFTFLLSDSPVFFGWSLCSSSFIRHLFICISIHVIRDDGTYEDDLVHLPALLLW